MSFVLGIVAALLAPFLMVIGFMVWDNHWHGSAFALNMYKCSLASVGFALYVVLSSSTRESIFPSSVYTSKTVGWLMVSSTLGILLGDWTWLEGMRLLGARKVIVMDSLKPVLAMLVGRLLLNEQLRPGAFVGTLFTVIGVALVGLERESQRSNTVQSNSGIDDDDMEQNNNMRGIATEEDALLGAAHVQTGTKEKTIVISTSTTESTTQEQLKKKSSSELSYSEQRRQGNQSINEIYWGLFMAVSNVVLHTFGVFVTKKYARAMMTWDINLIRFGFAAVCMLVLSGILQVRDYLFGIQSTTCHGKDITRLEASTENWRYITPVPWYRLPNLLGGGSHRHLLHVSLGVFFVSFLNPALTNYAVFQIAFALLLTLESIGPIYALPLATVLQHERPTLRGSLGAILAVLGIVVLSLYGDFESSPCNSIRQNGARP